MSKSKFNENDLIKILIKKASGFFYKEELLEYEKTQKLADNSKKDNQKCENISFFNKIDRGNTDIYKSSDIIEVSNGKPENFKQTNENLTLVKKKITTHYIPPDMLAIKILFEIFRKEIDINDIENMSNEELINLKNKLISEISNEN